MQTKRKRLHVVKKYEREWLPEGRRPDLIPISKGCAGRTYADLIKFGKFKKVRRKRSESDCC